MAQHRQELVLAPARLLGGLVRFPPLPAGRGELREGADDSLVLPVELPVMRVRDDPDGADGLAMKMEGDEQRLHEPRLGPQRRKRAVGEIHQLGDVLVDTDAAGAGFARHRSVAVGGE
ncbi:MAG: hypothetical protein ACREJG_00845, partial [Candidatus Rokuibacteriota bacterium]